MRTGCRRGVALALLLIAAPAGAWTPSTAPPLIDGQPMPAPEPRYGEPLPPIVDGNRGFPMPPPAGYAESAYPFADPGARPEQTPSGSGVAAEPVTRAFAGMRLTQQRDDDAYRLDIELNGLDPALVRVVPGGYVLVIIAEQAAQTSREESFSDGRGFRRSYSWSSGRRMERLPVPPDGDLAALRREDGDDHIRILIPRIPPSPPDPPRTPDATPTGIPTDTATDTAQ